MAIKSGKEYIDSLRDGRTLYIDGALVTDVTSYPPLQGVIGTLASLYDDQHDPAYRDVLTFRSPTTGEPVSKTYLEARTPEEVRGLAGCYHLRAMRTFGLMGRLTDFMSGFLVDSGRQHADDRQDRGGRKRAMDRRPLPRERPRRSPMR